MNKAKRKRKFNKSDRFMEEKVSAFGDIVEKIMQIILKIPDLFDNSLQDLNSKVTHLQNQLNAINRDISTLKSRSLGGLIAAAPAVSNTPGGPTRTPPKKKMIVSLSYFHRKIGPLVFYSYPKNSLDKDLSIKIADIMDQQFNEGFFTHSFENLKSMNYYFEIHSDWARGNNEMLMVSIIISQQISPEIEETISTSCRKFANKMQSNEEIFTGLYINEMSYYDEVDQVRIRKNEKLIKTWVNNLYLEIVEESVKENTVFMAPIAGTDVKRKKRRDTFGSDSRRDFFERLKRKHTFRMQHIDNILPTITEKLLYDILISIKKKYKHHLRSVDSIIVVLKKISEIKVQYTDSDSEFKEQLEKYRIKYFDLAKDLRLLFAGSYLSNDKAIVESFLNKPLQLEKLLPSITEPWLKEIIIRFRERVEGKRLEEKLKRDGSLKKEQVRRRLEKLKELKVKSERINFVITWDSFIEYIHRETRKKIEGNYLIIYARYLEDNLHYLYDEFMDMRRTRRFRMVVKPPSRVYERIDDKIDIEYISNLERRLSIFYKKIELLKKEIDSSKLKLEFIVNDFITLKLENNRTFIYIKGKRFIQCIRLFLQISHEERDFFEEVESIDEAAEVYKQSLWKNRIVEGPTAKPSRFQNRTITPEQEFWGHCSNLQVWAEHDYDTRILHRSMAFNLLKQLTFVGDPKAKVIFEEEIAIRFESGYFSVVAYLLEQGYLHFLDKDQLKILLENAIGMEERFKENINVLVSYGTLYIKTGNYTKAIKMLEKSLEIDPKFNFKALFFFGIAYGILGDHSKASQSFREIIENFKWQDLERQERAELYLLFKMTLFGRAVSISCLNEYTEIFNLYTSLLTKQKTLRQVHDKLIDRFKRLAKETPQLLLIENGYLYYKSEEDLKYILENVTKLPIGREDLKKIHPHTLYLLGIAYGCLNQHEKAMQSFRKVLEINDLYDIAWFGLGLSYIRSDEYIRLIKLLTSERSLIDSRFLEPFYSHTMILEKNNYNLHKKWYEKTINALESFIQLNPDNALVSRDLDTIKDHYRFKFHLVGRNPANALASRDLDAIKDRNRAKFHLVSIDPTIKGNIQAFLDWVKDPEGLAGYINYYLQQNDIHIISQLSKIYKEFKQIFGV